MKNRKHLVPWLILAALLLAGCTGSLLNGTDGTFEAAHLWKGLHEIEQAPTAICASQTVELLAGQHITAGSVTVANDSTNLYVTYETTGGWTLTQTHLAVAASLDGIPQSNGNPIPGQFPYKQDHDPPVMSYTYTIALGNAWTSGTVLYIAAHAVVVLSGGSGGTQEETAWGDGNDFPGKNWATYFTYTVDICQPPPDLAWLFRTQTQGGWGAPAHGNNPGVYRDAHFAAVFPSGLVIGRQHGSSSGYAVTFTSAAAVEAFLPAGGQPNALDGNDTDPISTSAGVLAGQVLALSLSVGFDLADPDFCRSGIHLKDLVVADASSPCFGWTVQQVLDEANAILAGLPSSLSPNEINEVVSRINENFVDGIMDGGYLRLP